MAELLPVGVKVLIVFSFFRLSWEITRPLIIGASFDLTVLVDKGDIPSIMLF